MTFWAAKLLYVAQKNAIIYLSKSTEYVTPSMNPNVSLDSRRLRCVSYDVSWTLDSSLVTDGPLQWGKLVRRLCALWGWGWGGWYIGTLCSMLLVNLKML